MAFGDPMVLATLSNGGAANVNHDSLLVNGPMDLGTDGWEWEIDSASPVVSVQFGARTGGAGSEYHRLTFTTPGTVTLGYYKQGVTLRGHPGLGNYGHQGLTINARIYAKRNDASGGSVTGTVQIAESILGVTNGGTQVGMATGTWYTFEGSRVIAALSNLIEIRLKLDHSGAGSPVIDVDEALLWFSYTFTRNPGLPSRPTLIVPGQSFQRAENGDLYQFGPSNIDAARYEHTLRFGMVGLGQVKALRSLYLLRVPLQWTPNLPDLPTYIDCRMTGFSFEPMTHSTAADKYAGTITLAEI